MSFSTIIEKLAKDSPALNEAEKQEIVLQARAMEQATALFTSLISPGSQILSVEGLVTNDAKITNAEITDATIDNVTITNADITTAAIDSATITNGTISSATAGGGDVLINTNGIQVKNTSTALVSFARNDNAFGHLNIGSNGDNLGFYNNIVGGDINSWLTMTDSERTGLLLSEDPDRTNRTFALVDGGDWGGALSVNDNLILYGQGPNASSYTYIMMGESQATPPTPIGASSDTHIYVKNNKLVIQFDDAGTVRYKYLDLTGTGVTWVHTTSAP